jgi:hypothetical protein
MIQFPRLKLAFNTSANDDVQWSSTEFELANEWLNKAHLPNPIYL